MAIVRPTGSDARDGGARVRCVVVRYHEVALKGGKRRPFTRKLVENLKRACAGTGVSDVRSLAGRIVLNLSDDASWPRLRERLEATFGVANFSLACEVPLDLDAIKQSIARELDGLEFESFRIKTKRANKQFPLTSPEINTEVGRFVQERTGKKVDLKGADLTVSIEVLKRSAFVSFAKVAGPGGLPVSVGGHVLCLLSGGIDSPVAAARMMRRGCRVSFVHFHGTPFTDRTSQDKARELVALLTRHQFHSRLFLVPFGEIQSEVVASVGRRYRVIVYRRLMLRIAEAIARREGASALVTGESLGQVASQTLANMAVISQACSILILRPLVGMDKSEISAEAIGNGTFDISIVEDQDCCTLFVPKHPATRASASEVVEAEARLSVDSLVARGLAQATTEEFFFP